MGHRPSSSDHFGLLNIAKPAGWTSRVVVDHIQRLVRPAKAGHAGTLDPLATGVLIVCVGQATRLVPLIHELPKVYRATFLLGHTSQTDDIEGAIVETPAASHPTHAQVLAALPEFVGRIAQRPPAFSAVRIGGRRAYKLARSGNDVDVPTRTVDVHRLELVRFEYPELVLEIKCGTGTYVRSIGRDLGERLRCGALMCGLERTAIGPFQVRESVAPEAVTHDSLTALMLPAAAAVPDLPRAVVDAAGVAALSNGRNALVSSPPAVSSGAASVAAVDEDGRLIALAQCAGNVLQPNLVFYGRS